MPQGGPSQNIVATPTAFVNPMTGASIAPPPPTPQQTLAAQDAITQAAGSSIPGATFVGGSYNPMSGEIKQGYWADPNLSAGGFIGNLLGDVGKTVDKAAPILAAAAISYILPGVSSAIASSLLEEGVVTSTEVANLMGNAIASTAVSVAQGQPIDKALTNAIVSAAISTGSVEAAKEVNTFIGHPAVTDAIVSAAGSAVKTIAAGGTEADITQNMIGSLAGSAASSAYNTSSDSVTNTTGRVIGSSIAGAVTGGTLGALTGAAGELGNQQRGAVSGAIEDVIFPIDSGGGSDATPVTSEQLSGAGDVAPPGLEGPPAPAPELTPTPTPTPAPEPTLQPTPSPTATPGTPPPPDVSPAPTPAPNPDQAILDLINPPVVEPTPAPEITPPPEPAPAPELAPLPAPEITPAPAPAPAPEPEIAPEALPTPVPAPVPAPEPALTSELVPTPEPVVPTVPVPAPEPITEPAPVVASEPDVLSTAPTATAGTPPPPLAASQDQAILDLINAGANTSTGDVAVTSLDTGAATAADTGETAVTDQVIGTGVAAPDQALLDLLNPQFPTVDVTKQRIKDITSTDIIDAPTTLATVTVTGKRDPVTVTAKKDSIKQDITDTDIIDEPATIDEPKPEDKPYNPNLFILGKVAPKTTKPSTSALSQALGTTTGLASSRGAGEIEDPSTGKKRRNVWNEESLRLKDALGI